jgi:hypothetical protein
MLMIIAALFAVPVSTSGTVGNLLQTEEREE